MQRKKRISKRTGLKKKGLIKKSSVNHKMLPKDRSASKGLHDTEQLFRALADASPVGVYLIQDGILKYVNKKSADILGYRIDEMIEKIQLRNIVPAEDLPRAMETIKKRLTGESMTTFYQGAFIRKDTTRVQVEVYGSRIIYGGKPAVIGSLLDVTPRKHKEEQLKESEEKFRMFSEASPIGIYIVQDGIIRYINRMAAKLSGYSVEEVVDTLSPEDVIFSDDIGALLETRQRLLSGETEAIHYKARLVRKNKEILDIENYSSLIQYHGRPAIIGTMLDVGEQKKTERQLMESEEKFRTLAEASVVGVYIYQDGIYVYINPRAAEIMGYTVEESLGKLGPKDIVVPEDMPFLDIEIQKRLSGEVPRMHYEVRAIRKDKKRIFCDVYDALITYQGRPAIMGSFVDITSRKEAEEDLKESEQKFRMLTETSLVGVYVLQDYIFKYVNPVAAQMFGYSADEVIDKINPAQIVLPEDLPLVQENIRKRISGELETKHYEFRGITKDKRTVEIEIYGSRILYHGRPAIVGSVIDITDRNRAIREKEKIQAQVFQLQKMEAIGIMTSGVAHDLNNILTVVQGHAELGIMRLNEKKPIQHDLEEILDATVKGTSLTHQLLLFGRKSPLELVPVNINAVVNNIQKMLIRLIKKNIVLSFELADNIWMIKADTGNIQQVIMNLVINAGDAIDGEGTITVKTENSVIDDDSSRKIPESHAGNYVCLTVTDTGTGIDQQIIHRIFEPFFTTKGKEKGTGLGLSVVYGIAKQHNGWINVESTGGQGTTFKVYFPAVLTLQAEAVPESVSLKELYGNGERILLVEDEESMLNFVKIVLSENGYSVLAASSAEEAIKIFKRENHKLDLLFSDVVLPDSNGVRLAEELQFYKPELLCLLTSGYTDEKSQWALIRGKGYPFLQKPYTLYDLFKMIKDVFHVQPGLK